MAVSTQEQKLLIKLVISMLGISPGSAFMPLLVKTYEDVGHSLPDLALALAGLPQFQARYPAGMAGDAFATQFLTGMGLAADAGLHRLAADLFNTGTPPQQIMLAAVQALASPTVPAQYAAARALLDNKAEVAYYHTQIAGRTETDFAALAKVLENVTQDPASVAAAKLVLDQPLVPDAGGGGPPPVFAVTKGVGDIASFTTAGTQIDVTEAGGTFTFTSSGGSVGTATLVGPLAGIIVPAGTTLAIGSALAGNKAFSGAGTALVVANAGGEDLTAFTGTGVTGFALTSGQNYTLTASQAAIGRIGTGGVAGTLTDVGTTTVRDTLAALGGGTAATLKAHGADSVIASATTPGDISATTVAGIDSIVLAGGNYTMTAAQAALADGTTGTQVVTLTTQASGTLAASIESFALGNFANSVTLGAAGQNVSSAAGTGTTLAIAGTTPTGTWALAHGSDDTLVATNGANIQFVNGGAATTADKLALTDGIAMTRAQHEAFTTVTAIGGSDSVEITTGGAITAKAGIETYILSAGGPNTVTVLAGTKVTGSGANATTINVGGATVTGNNYALANGADLLKATDGANIAGATTSTVELLSLTGAVTMTAAQYNAFNTGGITATGNNDRIILTTALSGNETLHAAVEHFTFANANYAVTLGAAQSIDAQALAAGKSLALAGNSTASVALADGNLSASGATGNLTVTGGAGANTITLGSVSDTVNAGGGADLITGGGGADTLNGDAGNDTFLYGSMAQFLSANALLDLVDGGNDLDTAEIDGGITLTTASDLTRMVNVEQIKARSQFSTNSLHSVVVNSDFNLGGVTTIDLSGDTFGLSSSTINFSGVTTAMTLKGVGLGVNTITGGSGADNLVGGTGNDLFLFSTAAAAAKDTAITGGGGTDTVLFQSTTGETLVVGDKFSAGLSYLITTASIATVNGIGTTAENIDASTHTKGGVTLSGNAGANTLTGTSSADTLVGNGGADVLRGGSGNDTITTAGSAATYVFEATASNNGNDTLDGVLSTGKFDFSAFLGAPGALLNAAVDATADAVRLDLTANKNIGVRYGSSSLSTTNIKTASTGAAGEVIIANDGKAVVFSFASSSTGNNANGTIYYVEDVLPGVGEQWAVYMVGSMSSSNATILQMVNDNMYL